MSQDQLVADLKASLQDAADVFTAANDADFKRHLDAAAADLITVRPLARQDSLTLTAGEATYSAPADLVRFVRSAWMDNLALNPWDSAWPGSMPRVSVLKNGGGRLLVLQPAPSERQIAILGSAFAYRYIAEHVIDADAADTTVSGADRHVLLLRAQAEALKELAMRNITKPVQLGPPAASVGSMPKNSAPAALYVALLEEFRGQ